MRTDNFQNFYNKWEHNTHFDHNRKLELEGSSHNGGIFSGFDQTENHQTASNNLKLRLHPQGGSPIGLTLKKSNSLINLVEMTLCNDKEQKKQTPPEKLKASNFPALLLQIGSWKRISNNEGDLVVKLYYAKKKLVWEFLDGPLKSKIEIQWSEISAIRSFICGDHGRLEIELNQPPQFGKEINPQPRKHTQWKQTTDFTGGQASVCRRHSVIFPPGFLDKPYEKLLQCDNRLFSLNQRPFPVNNYPFFDYDPNHFSTNIHHRSHAQSHGNHDSNLTSVMALSYSIAGARIPTTHNSGAEDHVLACYGQESWIVQQSQTKMLNDGIDFSGYENGGISDAGRLLANSEIDILEPDLWEGVPNVYGLPWE